MFRRVVACRTGLGHPGGHRHEEPFDEPKPKKQGNERPVPGCQSQDPEPVGDLQSTHPRKHTDDRVPILRDVQSSDDSSTTIRQKGVHAAGTELQQAVEPGEPDAGQRAPIEPACTGREHAHSCSPSIRGSPRESQTHVASRLAVGFLRRRLFFMIDGVPAGWMVIAFTRCPAVASPGEPEQPRYRCAARSLRQGRGFL